MTNIPGIGHFPKVPPNAGGKIPNSLLPLIPNGPNDFSLNMDEADDGSVFTPDPHADNQGDKETLISPFNGGLLMSSIFIAVVLIIGVLILAFFYRGSPFSSAKKETESRSPSSSPSKNNRSDESRRRGVHGSWESNIDSNHNQRHREQVLPVRLFTDMTNWFNRKKRLFHARRGRRSNRLPNQPKTRAMFYYNNGRAAAALAAGNGNSSTGNGSTHYSFGSNQSRLSTSSPTADNEVTAALISANHLNTRLPPISLVSNPNYLSETEQHLLENTCKFTFCFLFNSLTSFSIY